MAASSTPGHQETFHIPYGYRINNTLKAKIGKEIRGLSSCSGTIKKEGSLVTEQGEWGPGLLLDAGQTLGKGASLTSSMRLLSAIKMEVIGGTTAKNNKMTSLDGDKEAVNYPQQRRMRKATTNLRGKETVTSTRPQG